MIISSNQITAISKYDDTLTYICMVWCTKTNANKYILVTNNHASKCVVSYEKASKYKKEANSAVTSICWEVQKKGKRRE